MKTFIFFAVMACFCYSAQAQNKILPSINAERKIMVHDFNIDNSSYSSHAINVFKSKTYPAIVTPLLNDNNTIKSVSIKIWIEDTCKIIVANNLSKKKYNKETKFTALFNHRMDAMVATISSCNGEYTLRDTVFDGIVLRFDVKNAELNEMLDQKAILTWGDVPETIMGYITKHYL